MLFGYPIEATQENWLHDCLCEIIKNAHACIDAGAALPAWPDIVPLAYRDTLRSRRGIKKRVREYFNAATPLTTTDRQDIVIMMEDQNRISDLLTCAYDCCSVNDLPVTVRDPVRKLFEFGFGLLTDFGVRDRQYKRIHDELRFRLCPFCGCEYFSSPDGHREALDHYLAKSTYPFAAVNLRNLIPMGYKCNSQYKGTEDILHREDRSRCRVFDPYDTDSINVILDKSLVNLGADGSLISEWVVEFSREEEETETWDRVFSIRERYKRDFLDERSFVELLREFGNWCVSTRLHITGDEDVLSAVERYEQFLTSCGYRDRAFLKAAVFKMLLARCREGCDRVLGIMRDLVGLPQPA